jgi:hypothetical protein
MSWNKQQGKTKAKRWASTYHDHNEMIKNISPKQQEKRPFTFQHHLQQRFRP